ncbi:MAG: hypothetical protein LV468_03120 [Candidatus Nitrosotenuis sp.]|nr:hypothetical protein [Candidatus Nitrosotenuis sp.]
MARKRRFQNDDNAFEMLSKMYRYIKEQRQRRMEIPTDPKEIHRRADEIRARLKAERERQKEIDRINEDLRLIEFDLTVRKSIPKREPPIRKGIKVLCRTLKSRL